MQEIKEALEGYAVKDIKELVSVTEKCLLINGSRVATQLFSSTDLEGCVTKDKKNYFSVLN